MEENVWTNADVRSYVSENFILVSLYVDDRAKLPILERFTYATTDKKEKEINTQGDKWSTFEAENFQQVSQSLYAVLRGEEKLLNSPVGYTPDDAGYLEWLQCGKDTFDEETRGTSFIFIDKNELRVLNSLTNKLLGSNLTRPGAFNLDQPVIQSYRPTVNNFH